MAEVIALITSIGSITAAGFKIARAIAAVADDFDSASGKVKAIAIDVRTIGTILRQIRSHLNASENPGSETIEVLGKIVSQCKIDIDDIEEALLPLVSKGGESMNMGQRLRWLFAKSKIYGKQATLDSLKLTLTLFLHTMEVLGGEDIGDFREEIESAISETRKTKKAFLKAERLDQATTKLYEATYPTAETKQGGDDQGAQAASSALTAVEFGGPQNHKIEELVPLAGPSGPAGDGLTQAQGDDVLQKQHPTLASSDFDIVETLSDDDFMRIAEHMRLQKVVTNFALVVLDRESHCGAERDVSGGVPPGSTVDTDAGVEAPTEPFVPPATSRQPKRTSGHQPKKTSSRLSHSGSPSSDTSVHEYISSLGDSTPPGKSFVGSGYRHPRLDKSVPPGSGRSTSYSVAPDSMFGAMPHLRQGSVPHPHYQHGYHAEPGFSPPPWGYDNMPYNPFGQPTITRPDPLTETLQQRLNQLKLELEQAKRTSQAAPVKDPAVEAMRAELELYQQGVEKRRAAEAQKAREEEIRRSVEDQFHRRMEEMRRAQEEAKKEIEKAKGQAERAALERLHAEKEAEEERRRLHEAAMNMAERDARRKIEAEIEAKEEAARTAEAQVVTRVEAALIAEEKKRQEAQKREWEDRKSRGFKGIFTPS